MFYSKYTLCDINKIHSGNLWDLFHKPVKLPYKEGLLTPDQETGIYIKTPKKNKTVVVYMTLQSEVLRIDLPNCRP